MQVKVHWDRDSRLWTILHGKVRSHDRAFALLNARAEINQRGLERIRCGGKRFPCVFVVGDLDLTLRPTEPLTPVTFHPHVAPSFLAGQTPVSQFGTAHFLPDGRVLATRPR